MIKAHCRTNLDGFDCSKVTVFVALPRIGDKVEVLYRGIPAILEVCSITHGVYTKTGYPYQPEPFVSIELTSRPRE